MKRFAIHLWKEWRDHRAVAVGFLVACPVVLAIAAAALPSAIAADALFATVAALGAAAIACIAIGADLVPGETVRGTMRLLTRVPGALPAAFAAKLAALLAALAAFAGYAYLCAGLASAAFAGGALLPAPDGVAGYAVPILVASLWTLAVSCWLPRGSMAVPATLLLLGAIALPVYLLVLPLRLPHPEQAAASIVSPETATWLLAAGAVVAAFASFARGYRAGGTALAAAKRGLLAVLALALPTWGYVHHEVEAWLDIRPDSKHFQILEGVVGEGGHYAFLEVTQRDAMYTIIVDLESGTWRQVGWLFDRWIDQRFGPRACVPYVQRYAGDGGYEWYDARSGERVATHGFPRPASMDALARAAARAHPMGILPDGRRWWRLDGNYERDTLDGGFETTISPGWRRVPGGGHEKFDPWSWGTVVVPAEVGYPFERPGRSWVNSQLRILWDPATNERRPIKGIAPDETLRGFLEDGRIAVGREGEPLHLVDPETGARTATRVEGELVSTFGRTPGGEPIYGLYMNGEYRLFRLDGDSMLMTPAGFHFLGCPDGEHAIVCDAKRVYRVRFGSDEVEQLFPR